MSHDQALESTVLSIKNQTDKLKFNTDSDVVATLDGETVNLAAKTEAQINSIKDNVNQIKTKIDAFPNELASSELIDSTKNDIIEAICTNKALLDLLLKVETGNWEIKNYQWIYYDADGNELFRFNLFDERGNFTNTRVFKRIRVCR